MKNFLLIFISLLLISATTRKNGFKIEDPLIPIEDILSGGPPKDGIPSIDSPEFIGSKKAKSVFNPDARALVIEVGGVKKAYPIPILNWHEVVNDQISEFNIAVTYCPLCGSGIIFLSDYGGRTLQFGVSGLLYQSNVLLYDRQTESLWSQLELKAISGKYKGTPLIPLPTAHINLHKYLEENPDALTLSTKTGFVRDYSSSPYQGYERENKTYFPVNITSNEYHKKKWSLLVDKKLIIPLGSLQGKKGNKVFKVGKESFKVRWDKEKKELVCEAQAQRCISAYFFALKTFYPEAKIN